MRPLECGSSASALLLSELSSRLGAANSVFATKSGGRDRRTPKGGSRTAPTPVRSEERSAGLVVQSCGNSSGARRLSRRPKPRRDGKAATPQSGCCATSSSTSQSRRVSGKRNCALPRYPLPCLLPPNPECPRRIRLFTRFLLGRPRSGVSELLVAQADKHQLP